MNSFLATLRQLGPARLAIMGMVLAGLLGFFGFMSMRISSPGMKLLYDNISAQDAGGIAAKLDEAKIRYDVSPDGSRISVPGNDVGRARMLLAKDGLPNGGTMGYEIFDQQSAFGTTSFVQNIDQVRALEGELARTISSVSAVRSARVHLVLPERELFSRDNRPASAAVFLTLRGAAKLDREQVAAIQSLVAAAVPDLKAQGVSVIDSNGNLLARGGDDAESGVPVEAEEMQHSYEQRVTNQIEDLVGRVVGYGHVHATVAANLDFDRTSINSETYDPNGQVARSTQTSSDKNSEHEAGSQNANDVSVQNNLPAIAGADSGGAGGGTGTEANKTEETTNYEISKTTKQTISGTGEVKHLSIAVLVDGTYDTDKDGKKTYKPRSQAELDKISALVKSAVGFDDKRGDTIDVANMQYADVDTDEAAAKSTQIMGFERSDLLSAAEVVTLAIMGILVLLLVIRPMVGSVLAVENAGGAGGRPMGGAGGATALLPPRTNNPALPAPKFESASGGGEEDSLIDMSRVEGKVKASAVKKVEDIVNNYPGETVSVIRSWMSQET